MGRFTRRINDNVIDITSEHLVLTHKERVQELFKRLAYYEDLEEQGLLIRLPCKIGQTLYSIDGEELYVDRIDEITIMEHDKFCIACNEYKLEDFGKIAFTSREEAKKALSKPN